jgi:hypothetical protein
LFNLFQNKPGEPLMLYYLVCIHLFISTENLNIPIPSGKIICNNQADSYSV